jgi:hypothetical protein
MREERVDAGLRFRIAQNNFDSPVLLGDGVRGLDGHHIEGITGLMAGDAVADIKVVAGIDEGQQCERRDEHARRESLQSLHANRWRRISGGAGLPFWMPPGIRFGANMASRLP